MSELTEVERGFALYGSERTERVAPSFRDGAWSVLRVLLQLDHKLWRNTLLRRLLAISDAAAVLVASALVVAVQDHADRIVWLMAFTPIWLVLAKTFGLYDRDHRALRHLTIDEVPTLLVWVLTASLVTTSLARIVTGGGGRLAYAVTLALLASGTTFFGRSLVRFVWRRVTP